MDDPSFTLPYSELPQRLVHGSACTTRRLCAMLGYTSNELLRLNILDTYPKDLRDVGKVRLDSISSGEKLRFEHQMVRRDGFVFPAETSMRKLAEGTIQGIAHDATERRQLESESSLERSLLMAMMENVPDYVYFKDKESRFILTNRAHARALGLRDPTEAIGKSDRDFFSEDHARKAYEDEQRIIRTGEALFDAEERETRPNRPDTWALTTKMPLRDQRGIIPSVFRAISRTARRPKNVSKALPAFPTRTLTQSCG